MSNGDTPHAEARKTAQDIPISLENVTYGLLRKFRKLPEEQQEDYFVDEIMPLVVPGGIEHLPFLLAGELMDRVVALVQESRGGKAPPGEPSSVDLGAESLSTPATKP